MSKNKTKIDEVKEAHDKLSALLEDPDAGNDDVRDAAIEMCAALNASYTKSSDEGYKCYLVSWSIDIQAKSRREAAEKALAIQRDINSTATIFDVTPPGGAPKEIDLLDGDESHEDDETEDPKLFTP